MCELLASFWRMSCKHLSLGFIFQQHSVKKTIILVMEKVFPRGPECQRFGYNMLRVTVGRSVKFHYFVLIYRDQIYLIFNDHLICTTRVRNGKNKLQILEFKIMMKQVNIYLCALRCVSRRLNGRTGRRAMNWKVPDIVSLNITKKTKQNPGDVTVTPSY